MHFGCLYIPAFPAWVFEQVDPVAAPVIVTASGEVVACSRKLRSAGISEGIRAERAERLAPEGTLLRARDVQLEEAAWDDVLHELNTCTPFLEPQRPGLVYFRPFPGVQEVARRLKAQAALAPHRSTALLAALRAAEGHVLEIRKQHTKKLLDRIAMDRLSALDFSDEIIEQLPLFGFGTLGSALGLAPRHLQAQFGEEGLRLYRLIHPEEQGPIAPYVPPPTVSRAYEFDLPCSEPGELIPVLEFLTRQAVAELKHSGAQRIKIRLHDRLRPSAFTCRVLPEASNDARRLFSAGKTLLLKMLDRSSRVQALELELGSLRNLQVAQGSLFFRRPASEKAVRTVHRRYPDALRRPSIRPDAVFDEDRFSLEPLTA